MTTSDQTVKPGLLNEDHRFSEQVSQEQMSVQAEDSENTRLYCKIHTCVHIFPASGRNDSHGAELLEPPAGMQEKKIL